MLYITYSHGMFTASTEAPREWIKRYRLCDLIANYFDANNIIVSPFGGEYWGQNKDFVGCCAIDIHITDFLRIIRDNNKLALFGLSLPDKREQVAIENLILDIEMTMCIN